MGLTTAALVAQIKTDKFVKRSTPIWMSVFEKDLENRLKNNKQDLQRDAPSAMTMMAARMVQQYAQAHDYNTVLIITSALASDPDMPKMFKGDKAQQTIAKGLIGVAHKVATDRYSTNRVQKIILNQVLNICYEGGQRDALVKVAKKASTPIGLSYSIVAVMTEQNDRDALVQLEEIRHDVTFPRFVDSCIRTLDSQTNRLETNKY